MVPYPRAIFPRLVFDTARESAAESLATTRPGHSLALPALVQRHARPKMLEHPPEPAAFWAQLFIQMRFTGGTIPERPK
jgi:hypothetical protein